MTFLWGTDDLGYVPLTSHRLRQMAESAEAAALNRESGARVLTRDPHAAFWAAVDAKRRGETPTVLAFRKEQR